MLKPVFIRLHRDRGGGYRMRRRRIGKLPGWCQRATEFFDSLLRTFAHLLENRSVFRIIRQVDQLVGILPKVMKKLVVVVEVSHVLEIAVPNAVIRRNPRTNSDMLMERLRAPVDGLLSIDYRLETVPLVNRRNFCSRPVQER